MACAACNENQKKNFTLKSESIGNQLLSAEDIFIIDGEETRKLNESDINPEHHKLLLFYPSSFTPVCSSEMGALNGWIDSFKEQNVDVYTVCVDPIRAIQEWYNEEEAIKNPQYTVMSSYLLPSRLNLIEAGRTKRASTFITNKGEVITQEHFFKVGRSLAELHRMIYAYNTDSYCAEGWTNPSDGFLTNDNNQS